MNKNLLLTKEQLKEYLQIVFLGMPEYLLNRELEYFWEFTYEGSVFNTSDNPSRFIEELYHRYEIYRIFDKIMH